MFIPRHVYDTLHDRAIKAEAVEDSLVKQNAQLSAHIEWMRVLLNKSEAEKAGLVKRYLGVDIPVPVMNPVQDDQDLNQTMDFRDVGDAEAKRLGLDWNSDGTVRYTK